MCRHQLDLLNYEKELEDVCLCFRNLIVMRCFEFAVRTGWMVILSVGCQVKLDIKS